MYTEEMPNLSPLIKHLVHSGTAEQYRAVLNTYHEADIAEALEQLSPEEQFSFFNRVKPDMGAEILEEMALDTQLGLISELKTSLAAKFIGEMESDDAADLMEELLEEDTQKAEQIIQALKPEDKTELIELLSYPVDSAGALMSHEVIAIPENLSVAEALETIRKLQPPNTEVSFYIFIVDKDHKLVGVTTLRDLVLANAEDSIRSIRDDSPIKTHVLQDQEEIAKMIRKYDLISLPVVDDDDVLLGLITVDDVVDVVIEEASEDFQRLSGTNEYDESKLLSGRFTRSIFSRLPWLLLTVVGGIAASSLMTSFSSEFTASQFSLALSLSFVPLLMGLGGNVGNQSATIMVRGLSLGLLKNKSPFYYIARETGIGLCIGLSIATSFYILSSFLLSISSLLTFIVCISLTTNITVATFIGAALPIILDHLKIDPAVACAPVISSTLDIVGQLIYFGLTLSIIQAML